MGVTDNREIINQLPFERKYKHTHTHDSERRRGERAYPVQADERGEARGLQLVQHVHELRRVDGIGGGEADARVDAELQELRDCVRLGDLPRLEPVVALGHEPGAYPGDMLVTLRLLGRQPVDQQLEPFDFTLLLHQILQMQKHT